MLLCISEGVFSKLRVEELASLGELSKPDFIINPHLYFGKMWDSSSPTPPPLPVTGESRVYSQLISAFICLISIYVYLLIWLTFYFILFYLQQPISEAK